VIEGFPRDRYPGRGLIVGRAADGETWLQLYWITGRSENSRNRVLVERDGEVRTATFDASRPIDPTFTLYAALLSVGGAHVVGNGDQVATVAEALASGRSFEAALRTRTVEEDPPIWTPRITAMLDRGRVRLSRIDRAGHFFFGPLEVVAGTGLGLQTYRGDGNPVRTFEEGPYSVRLSGRADELAREAWDLLEPDLRVALAVKKIGRDGAIRHILVNGLAGG
jgi:IMP cyclohydrolase